MFVSMVYNSCIHLFAVKMTKIEAATAWFAIGNDQICLVFTFPVPGFCAQKKETTPQLQRQDAKFQCCARTSRQTSSPGGHTTALWTNEPPGQAAYVKKQTSILMNALVLKRVLPGEVGCHHSSIQTTLVIEIIVDYMFSRALASFDKIV